MKRKAAEVMKNRAGSKEGPKRAMKRRQAQDRGIQIEKIKALEKKVKALERKLESKKRD
jgi:hypothetical protein